MLPTAPNEEAARRRNALLATAIIAFGLGVVATVSVALMLHAWWHTHSAAEYAFGMHLLVVHVAFHFTEFIVAAAQRPRETGPEAFMIGHSFAYFFANAFSFFEFFVEVFLIPETWKPFGKTAGFSFGFFLFRLNFVATTLYGVLVCVFYGVRVAAMVQCGPNFSLIIENERRPDHVLISRGLYAVLRHPAYFGWFWRIPFSQLMLANPISAIIHTAITWSFFKRRIPYEEDLMEANDYFGSEYKRYKVSTHIGIPFIQS